MSTDNKPMKKFIVPNLRKARDIEKLKGQFCNEKLLGSIVTINDINDDFIYMNICDKVDVGAILPSGRVLTNKDDNGFRSLNFKIKESGEIIDFRGYINTKNGLNEYFELNSTYAVPLYKKTHFTLEELEKIITDYIVLRKK